MKKILAVILAMAFVVSVCSCSEQTSQSGEETTTTTTQTTVTTTAPTTTAATTATTTIPTTTIPTTTARPKAEIWYATCLPARGNTTLNPEFEGSIEITRRMGIGYSNSKVKGPVAGALVVMLENLKVTGEVRKVTETNIREQPMGTVFIDYNGATYRVTSKFDEIYRVDVEQGKEYGLKMTDEFSDELKNTVNYWPYYSYSGIYQDNVLRYRTAYVAKTDVYFAVKDIYIEKDDDPNNYIELEVTSSVDKEVGVSLDCMHGDDLVLAFDNKKVDLKANKPQRIKLNFAVSNNFGSYSVDITADKTKFHIWVVA
ncbi:MAG: hypothetical protein IJF54_07170 [Clostridia bacterium]|nr:hypothetical protein [Clostridia bacterium]